MNEFLKKFKSFLAFFVLVGTMLTILLFVFANFYLRNNRLASMKLKHERLMKLKTRKIILVGGSNLPYGVDSSILVDSTGFDVVNMGLQASIGLKFMLEEVIGAVNEGDIVVVVPEYQLFFNLNLNGESTLYRALVQYPDGIEHLSAMQAMRFFYYFPNVLQGVVEDIKFETILAASGMKGYNQLQNEYGDYVGHEGKGNRYKFDPRAERIYASDFQQESLQALTSFQQGVHERNAKMFVVYPTTARSYADIFPKLHLLKNLSSFVVLGDTTTFTYPDSCFFDTPHHLAFQYRAENSIRLAKELNKNNREDDVRAAREKGWQY
jgi:hypothetical protein